MFRFSLEEFSCFYASLRVNEAEAWTRLRGRELSIGPFFVGREGVYFTDDDAIQDKEFTGIVKTHNVKQQKLNKPQVAYIARIVGSLLYGAFHIFFCKAGFESFNRSLYYRNEDFYVKAIYEDEGTYLAIRGIFPKVHARDSLVFLVTDSCYRIKIEQWEKLLKWLGHRVKAEGFKGYLILEEVNLADGKVTVKAEEGVSRYPIGSIYVPAEPSTLSERGIFDNLQEFSQFRETSSQSEYKFLDSVCEQLGIKDSFNIPLDLSQNKVLTMNRVYFGGEI